MQILLVEDEPEMARLLIRALETQGHGVAHLASGFGVVNRVAGRSGDAPELVILDFRMPGLSGGSLLELLAQEPTARNVPVILHSSCLPEEYEAQVRQHPRCVSVAKGDLEELLRAVEQLALRGPPAS